MHSPLDVYFELNATGFNKTYFQVNVHRVAITNCSFDLPSMGSNNKSMHYDTFHAVLLKWDGQLLISEMISSFDMQTGLKHEIDHHQDICGNLFPYVCVPVVQNL